MDVSRNRGHDHTRLLDLLPSAKRTDETSKWGETGGRVLVTTSRNTSGHQDKQIAESPVPIPGMENAMRCDLCDREVTNGNLLCQSCADMIPPFGLAPPVLGTELALALAAELAPYLATD